MRQVGSHDSRKHRYGAHPGRYNQLMHAPNVRLPRNKRGGLVLILGFALALTSTSARAALSYEWIDGASYDPAITSPDTFLGEPFADRHASVDEISAYSRLLASQSDRVTYREYGHSVEGDPLAVLIITDPANHERLPGRRDNLEKLRDPWQFSDAQRREAVDAELPLTFIACSVHGDEASGADAGLLLAYYLAAGRDARAREILANSVVLIDPCQNPDGRRRFLQHIRAFRRQIPEPDATEAAMEHNQLWPGGRRNHYLFDLNRDWAFLTQQETQARVAEFLRWYPQVFVDLHEMGRESTYFFPPPSEPVNPNVPDELRAWWDRFGRANARAFDAKGFDYFVRESFDLFYPGYGDSWPTLHGAVGMTYEQSTTRGLVLRGEDGELLEYRDAVHHHLTAALATCTEAAANGRELLQSYAKVFDISKKRASRDATREIVFTVEERPSEAHRLAQVLTAQGVRVYRTLETKRARLRPYDGGETQTVELPPGSYRIPFSQPAFGLVKTLLDPETPLNEDFLQQERWRKEKGLRNRFYDVTAWSLILAYGLPTFASGGNIDVPSELVELGVMPPGDFEAARTGDAKDPYAYLIPYHGNGAIEALGRLLWNDVKVDISLDGFTQDGVPFPRGTLVVKSRVNKHVSKLRHILQSIVDDTGLSIRNATGAWVDEGPSLGSSRVQRVHMPRIAVVSGPGIRPASAGAVSWVLEARYGIPHTAMLVRTLAETDLSQFNVIVVPEVVAQPPIDWARLDPWVRAGGTLVTLGSASVHLVHDEGDLTTVRVIEDLRDLEDDAESSVSAPEDERPVPAEHRPDHTPGAILSLDVDLTHFLTLGEHATTHAPVYSDRLMREPEEGSAVATFAKEEPRVAGFMWPAMEDAIRGMAFLTHEPRDRGHLILFAEDPSFRGTWEGLDRFLLNAVLLGPSLGE